MSVLDDGGPHLVLLRHGDTAWALAGRHTGRTDVPLTPDGEEQARAAGDRLTTLLAGTRPAAVWCSPLARARRTAELAGLRDVVVDPDLAEWDYGPVEGRTSAEVAEAIGRPYEIFRDGVRVLPPGDGGEELDDVRARTESFLARVRPHLDDDRTVVVVAHGHLLRVLATAWLAVEPTFGAHLELGCAAVSVLGRSHGLPTLELWNVAER